MPFKTIFFLTFQYDKTKDQAIGSFRYYNEPKDPVKLCLVHYKAGNITKNSYNIDSRVITGKQATVVPSPCLRQSKSTLATERQLN